MYLIIQYSCLINNLKKILNNNILTAKQHFIRINIIFLMIIQ